MGYELLEVERAEKTATVTINRPDKRNALSIALRNEIDACFGELEDDDSVSAVILLTRGAVYCAGFDMKEFASRDPEHLKAFSDSSDRYHRRLAEFPKPIVTGVQGAAMAGGFDLAVLCDVRIAAAEAVFAHPEIKFGAPALFGPLREVIGGGMARDLCLTGRRIDAPEAHRIGLVSEVVELGRLTETCEATARMIAEAPLSALKSIKKQIVGSTGGWKAFGGEGNFLEQLSL